MRDMILIFGMMLIASLLVGAAFGIAFGITYILLMSFCLVSGIMKGTKD